MHHAYTSVGMLAITVLLVFVMLDFMNLSEAKHQEFEALRSANQTSLLNVEGDYDTDEITQMQIISEWLADYALKTGENIDNIKITITNINTDPPTIVMAIEGDMNSNTLIMPRSAVKYLNGASIITDDTEEGD